MSMPTPRAICASSTVARTCATIGFLHYQPQTQTDRGSNGDHEDAIERQEDPPIWMLCASPEAG